MMIYIFWSCKDRIEAKQMIYALLERKQIACASIIPNVESIYRWQGSVEESTEVKVIFKTVAACFDAVSSYIKTHGSYQVPEIVQVDITQGNIDYMRWVQLETTKECGKEGPCLGKN